MKRDSRRTNATARWAQLVLCTNHSEDLFRTCSEMRRLLPIAQRQQVHVDTDLERRASTLHRAQSEMEFGALRTDHDDMMQQQVICRSRRTMPYSATDTKLKTCNAGLTRMLEVLRQLTGVCLKEAQTLRGYREDLRQYCIDFELAQRNRLVPAQALRLILQCETVALSTAYYEQLEWLTAVTQSVRGVPFEKFNVVWSDDSMVLPHIKRSCSVTVDGKHLMSVEAKQASTYDVPRATLQKKWERFYSYIKAVLDAKPLVVADSALGEAVSKLETLDLVYNDLVGNRLTNAVNDASEIPRGDTFSKYIPSYWTMLLQNESAAVIYDALYDWLRGLHRTFGDCRLFWWTPGFAMDPLKYSCYIVTDDARSIVRFEPPTYKTCPDVTA